MSCSGMCGAVALLALASLPLSAVSATSDDFCWGGEQQSGLVTAPDYKQMQPPGGAQSVWCARGFPAKNGRRQRHLGATFRSSR
jgi:hypothetical protein